MAEISARSSSASGYTLDRVSEVVSLIKLLPPVAPRCARDRNFEVATLWMRLAGVVLDLVQSSRYTTLGAACVTLAQAFADLASSRSPSIDLSRRSHALEGRSATRVELDGQQLRGRRQLVGRLAESLPLHVGFLIAFETMSPLLGAQTVNFQASIFDFGPRRIVARTLSLEPLSDEEIVTPTMRPVIVHGEALSASSDASKDDIVIGLFVGTASIADALHPARPHSPGPSGSRVLADFP